MAAPTQRRASLVRLGVIVGAHGLAGGLKLRLDNPDSSSLDDLETVLSGDDDSAKEFRLISVARAGRGNLKIVLEGIEGREQAEKMRGTILYARAGELPPPQPGEFYYHQVIGLSVLLTDQTVIGTIEEAFFNGANDVWVVRGRGKEILIPVTADVVESIEPEQGRVTIRPVPGLLD